LKKSGSIEATFRLLDASKAETFSALKKSGSIEAA